MRVHFAVFRMGKGGHWAHAFIKTPKSHAINTLYRFDAQLRARERGTANQIAQLGHRLNAQRGDDRQPLPLHGLGKCHFVIGQLKHRLAGGTGGQCDTGSLDLLPMGLEPLRVAARVDGLDAALFHRRQNEG